jgi:hypothetical protein
MAKNRYMISLTDAAAAELESWLGGAVSVTNGKVELQIASLDAISDREYELIAQRLRTGPPLYHFGGPGVDDPHRAEIIAARQRAADYGIP